MYYVISDLFAADMVFVSVSTSIVFSSDTSIQRMSILSCNSSNSYGSFFRKMINWNMKQQMWRVTSIARVTESNLYHLISGHKTLLVFLRSSIVHTITYIDTHTRARARTHTACLYISINPSQSDRLDDLSILIWTLAGDIFSVDWSLL